MRMKVKSIKEEHYSEEKFFSRTKRVLRGFEEGRQFIFVFFSLVPKVLLFCLPFSEYPNWAKVVMMNRRLFSILL